MVFGEFEKVERKVRKSVVICVGWIGNYKKVSYSLVEHTVTEVQILSKIHLPR